MNLPNRFAEDPRDFPGHPQKSNAAATIIVVILVIGGCLVVACAGIMAMGVYMLKRTNDQFEQMVAEYDTEVYDPPSHIQEFIDANSVGDYRAALQSTEDALALNEDDAAAHNNKAWLLATCPDEQFRDGEQAVQHAVRACELTNWQQAEFIDTLAAAYAEAGDFDTAVQTQQQAIDRDQAGFFRDQFLERRKLYEAETPYREKSAMNAFDELDTLPYDEMDGSKGESLPPSEAADDET